MSEVAVELKLASEQYKQLTAVARAQQRSVTEVMQTAVTEWLAHQAHMERARDLMRELGQGLASGASGQPIAREHDTHLYSRRRGDYILVP